MITTTLLLILIFLITFTLGFTLTPYIVLLSRELHLYDLPDSRKVHKMPVPRIGGMAFLPSVIIAITLVLVFSLRFNDGIIHIIDKLSIQNFMGYVAGCMMLYVIGLYDDIHGVGYKAKFIVQILAAIMLCVGGLWIADFGNIFLIDRVPFWIGMPITILFVVYITNAINLIDGIDGLASGLASISMIVVMVLNIIINDVIWATLPVAFIGVLIAFFYYNVFDKSRKIFMGDAGSLTLGFTLAFLILHFWQANPIWNTNLHNIGIIAMSTLIIPMFDVVRVFMSRIRDGRNPFLADKNHIHHKLLRTGLNGRETMLMILILDILFICVNYFMASYISQTLMIVADILLFITMHYIINFFIYKIERNQGIDYKRSF